MSGTEQGELAALIAAIGGLAPFSDAGRVTRLLRVALRDMLQAEESGQIAREVGIDQAQVSRVVATDARPPLAETHHPAPEQPFDEAAIKRDWPELRERIRKALWERELRRVDLAHRLGLKENALNAWMSRTNPQRPSAEAVRAMRDWLDGAPEVAPANARFRDGAAAGL